MISAGDITTELLVSAPIGVYIQILRKEDMHMIRHLLVTPKQFCDLLNLDKESAISLAEEYELVSKIKNAQIHVDLMDFCFVYKLHQTLNSIPP